MEDKNEKFSEMAVKNPSKAVFYGMGLVILFLLGLWGKKELRISELEVELTQAKAEAKKEAAEQNQVFISVLMAQIEEYKEEKERHEERILELNEKVNPILKTMRKNDSRYMKMEAKLNGIDVETKKIEEVIQK